MSDPERGTCSYEVWHHVYFRTSGTELPGRAEFADKFATPRDAAQFLVDHRYQFYRKECSWMARGGYTTAEVRRVVEYGELVRDVEDTIS